jgi:urea transport system permease protein
MLLAALMVVPAAITHAADNDTDFPALVASLAGASFARTAELVDGIASSGHERAGVVLQALLEGNLQYRKSDRRVVIVGEGGSEPAIVDAVTGAELGAARKRSLKKVRTKNSLRRSIRGALAGLELTHPDAAKRLAAAGALLGSPDPAITRALRAALSRESDPGVREAMQLGLASIEVRSEQHAIRLGAVEVLAGSLRQEVLCLLRGVAESESETDTEVREAARLAVADIEARLWRYAQLENLFFGISLGSVLLLAAIGLAVTFGVMRVINMAHGEMVMLGAYTTYVVQTLLPDMLAVSLFIAIPAAFLVSGGIGVLMERGVIRFLYGRPLETLLATFGISLILQQTVRTVFSPLNRSVSTPQWMSGALELNPALSLTYNRLYILLFALLVVVGLALLLRRTRFGLEMRAVTQNRAMARAMGVRTARVDALTFGLGSGIAGMAGVALSQLTNVGPNMGQAYIVDSFMVVVFGGVGSLMGTFVGAMSLGVASKFLEPVTGTVLAKILLLVAIILFIQRRPQGLFALGGRSAD